MINIFLGVRLFSAFLDQAQKNRVQRSARSAKAKTWGHPSLKHAGPAIHCSHPQSVNSDLHSSHLHHPLTTTPEGLALLAAHSSPLSRVFQCDS